MIAVIIPCYNEAGNLKEVVEEIQSLHENLEIIIIDDASTDKTLYIAKKLQNVQVLNLPINLGVGAAMQLAFKKIAHKNYRAAIKFDGDGQHNPKYIKSLLKPILQNKADITIGSRYLKKNTYKTPITRRVGQKILALAATLLTKNPYTDPTSGLRAYNKKSIKFMAKNYPNFGYPEPEELILASKNNLKTQEIFVKMRPRISGNSSITSAGAILYMTKVLLAMFFIAIRK
jgi:glycosyltransferase involved in cell wall biosynthesis